jgi:hypothetical protein
VTYAEINLADYHGTLMTLGRTPHGGDYRVRWDASPDILSEECVANLRHARKES